MTKGDLMRKVYSEEELRNIDSAIPKEHWKSVDTWRHVMNYNNNVFGKLEDMLEVAYNRHIDLGEPLVRCNDCDWIGFEEDLKIDYDDVHEESCCPGCGAKHALADQIISKPTDKPLSALGYHKFIIHLKHDDGTVCISNVNTDIKKAIEAVLNAEGAPFRAIFRIDIKQLDE